MPVQLYIILHKTQKPKSYEWSLVAHNAGVPLPGLRPLNHFELVWRRQEHKWVVHATRRLFHTHHRFMGVIALPPCDDEFVTISDVEDLLGRAEPMPECLADDERRRWTGAKWICDLLVEWAPLFGINFISKLENRDLLLSLLSGLCTWLEEDMRHERVLTGDGYEYRCVRCPDHWVRPAKPKIGVRRYMSSIAPLPPSAPSSTVVMAG
jgi:hypothetical protein